MLKTKITITKWIESNFKNEHDFYSFLEYDYLNMFVQDGKKLIPQYQEQYNNLKLKWEELHNSINYLPEIQIVERYGKETHKTMRTPLNYMNWFYYSDEKEGISYLRKSFDRITVEYFSILMKIYVV